MIKEDLRVSIFTQTLLKGGAEKQAIWLAKALSKNYTVSIVVYYPDKIDTVLLGAISSDNIEIIKLNGSLFTKLLQLYKYLQSEKNTVLFNYLLLPNFLGGIVSKFAGIKKSIGGIRSSVLDQKKIHIERFLHNRINHFTIFNNQLGMESCIKNGFKKEKCFFIPNVLFPLPDIVERKSSSKVLSILSVGRFEEVKNYPLAISIIKELVMKGLNIRYTLIGWGSKEQEIRGVIKELKLESITDIVINPPNIYNYYNQADIYLQTSRYEGLSNTILEAMSFSLPIVASDVGDNSRLIDDKYNEFIIKEPKIDLYSNAIENLYNNISLRNEYGSFCYNRILNDYSIDRFTKNYNNFITLTLEE